jgi:FkbM family methyltransferase
VEISRYRPFGPRRARLLAESEVELVIDVGANRGQYALELRNHGYEGRIVSFEPSSDAYGELELRSAADERWQVRRLALSDGEPSLELGDSDNFGSALPVGEHLAALFPEAVPSTLEHVPAARLDQVDLELPRAGRTLLKLDVQGWELHVLSGAVGILAHVAIVETELSVVPLYEGQPLLADVLRAVEDAGFALVALEPILRDWRTGEHLQFDGLFVRSERGVR